MNKRKSKTVNDKLTPKQERFWVEYLATGNATEAYRRSYNTARMTDRTIQKRAGEQLAHGAIAGRIAAARAKAEDQGVYTLEQHMNELKTLREMAKRNGQISAAVAAEVKRGELMGYYLQRRESTNIHQHYISEQPLTEHEFEREHGLLGTANGQKH